ncbi:protein of unknown function (DUF4806) [Popillia japonica]|uniref:DUF4806 domain-containing protein n=1 Tax=Popillia japonica TaxID=7064 RepID=A0AAW1JVG6_POPJA
MAKKFAIVKYRDEDNSIGIIPLNWIFSNESSCLYPPAITSDTARDKLVMTEAEPIFGKWIVCNIRILHKSEAYSTARASLKTAKKISNLDTDDDHGGRRKRRKKHWGKDFLFSEQSSDDESDTVQQRIANQESVTTIAEPSCNDILGLLPLENLEDFNALEEKTKENNANQLVKIFAVLEEKTYIRSCLMDIMKRLMADMLAEEFSYSGKVTNNDNPKIAFCKKNICHIIHVAVRKIFKEDAKDDKIRRAICCWLQQAKARRSRR